MSHGLGETHRMPKDRRQELELATLAAGALSGILAATPMSEGKPLDPGNVFSKDAAQRAWDWAVLMYRLRPNVAKVLAPGRRPCETLASTSASPGCGGTAARAGLGPAPLPEVDMGSREPRLLPMAVLANQLLVARAELLRVFGKPGALRVSLGLVGLRQAP